MKSIKYSAARIPKQILTKPILKSKAVGTSVILILSLLLLTFLFARGGASATYLGSDQSTNSSRQIVLHLEDKKTVSGPEQNWLPLPLPALSEVEHALSTDTTNWKSHTVKGGDSLYKVLLGMGHSPLVVEKISALGDKVGPLLNLVPGQTLRVEEREGQFQSLEYRIDQLQTLMVHTENEKLVSTTKSKEVETRTGFSSATISNSLFLAATNAGMSDNLTMQLAKIFGWDIDFNLDIRPGDSFRVLYTEIFSEGHKISDGAILAAEFSVGNNTFKAVRFTDEKGNSTHYTPEGKSMRKAFTRNPLPFTRVTSNFNPNRRHPILNTTRPHNGVDYGAATGTPVMATGDGKVIFSGKNGGYGNTVIVKHGEQYSTLYAHLNSFNRHVKQNGWVKQGQTIGYVGKTGLATGPHLHYEFRFNGVHKNPLTVTFPHAAPIPKSQHKNFSNQSLPLLAQLEKYKSFEIASIAK